MEDAVDGEHLPSFRDEKIYRLYKDFTRRLKGRQYLLGYPPYFTHGDQRIDIFLDGPVPESLKIYQIDNCGTIIRSDWRQFLFFASVDESPQQPLINWLDFQFLIKKERLQEYDFSELIAYSNAT